MQRIFVDFGRGIGDEIDLLLTARPNVDLAVQEDERVVLYDSSLEVEGIAHQRVNTVGQTYWYALPDWTTQRDIVPFQSPSAQKV